MDQAMSFQQVWASDRRSLRGFSSGRPHRSSDPMNPRQSRNSEVVRSDRVANMHFNRFSVSKSVQKMRKRFSRNRQDCQHSSQRVSMGIENMSDRSSTTSQ